MFQFISLDVPPNTPESSPESLEIQLTEGVITNWWVGFPPGCVGLVHVAIYEYEHQIIPRAEDQDLYWDGYVFEIPDRYELLEDPYVVEVRAWSEDDIYQHTVTVGVAVEEIEEVTLKDLMRRFIEMMVGE